MMHRIKTYCRHTFSSLAIRNYRLYFMGQSISLSGTWMQTIAQSWLVLELTGSGTALGFVTALQFLPVLILGPWGGVVADRFSKRKLLYVTQATAGVLALILGILVATHTVQLWMVYVLAGFLGLVKAVDNPTRQTFVFEMVGGEHLKNAVTLNSMAVNLARVIGPAIAGIVIASIGLALCFILNAASFMAVLVCLYLMHSRELLTAKTVKRAKGQVREGLNYIWHTPLVRDVLIMVTFIGMFAYEFQVSLALLAKYTFHGNAGTYALLNSAMGIGAIMGGLIVAGRRKSSPKNLMAIAILFGLMMIVVSFSPNLPFAIAAMVIVGICSISFTSLGNTILQLESSPQMRSRVMAFWSVAFLGSTPIGGPIIGWIGEHIDPRWGIAVGGIVAIGAGIFGFIALKYHPKQKLFEGDVMLDEISSSTK
ncbi:MAG: MFS transporter [Candidatus Sungbacteria bacterium]|nr:MFS transporter [bacterium]MDZ4260133.1 MFS transporter [Candidatus Sungbacteria bacterium]